MVKIDSGRLEGQVLPGAQPVQAFFGIPFAAAPVGSLRWREPQPVAPWPNTRPATAFGPRCAQAPLYSDMMFRSKAASEDCLYLNVWTPAKGVGTNAARLPVLVYFYGGGFSAGDASEKRYDGAALAARGIVVVTVNYRLGIFGFLAHPELTAESPHHTSGNYGMLDQVAALMWAKRNIAAFGGDPDRITIGGESAGSMSVSALMASPLSRDLIAGAIGESGAMMQKWAPHPLAEAQEKGAAFTRSIGAPTLAELRAMPTDKLLAAQGNDDAPRSYAVLDNYFLTEPPAETFAKGHAAHVPLLVGTNSQEAPGTAVLGDGAAATIAAYRAGLKRTLGDKADAIFSLYRAHTDAEVMAMATAVASDDFLGLPTWKWFDLQRKAGAPVYLYYFTHIRPRVVSDPPGTKLPWGATHSSEIEYALATLDANPRYAWTDEDRAVSATMSGYFAAFIKTGDPNRHGLPTWPRASSDESAIQRQIIDVHTRSVPFPEQHRYVAADPLLYMH